MSFPMTLPTLTPRPGKGLGVLFRSDAPLAYDPPTVDDLRGIDLHPTSAEAAHEALAATVAVLRRRGDPRAVFPEVYNVITRNVVAEIKKGSAGLFKEPAWISRLAGRFAERYFDALVASLRGQPPQSRAWGVAFADGASGHTAPLLDALLGINAHINYDLAQGLADNVIGAGAQDDPEKLDRYKHDHDAVNLILRASMPEVLDVLEEVYGCRVTRQLSRLGLRPMAYDYTLGLLQRWREGVWGDLTALLAAGGEAGRAAVVERMNERSEAIARTLSVRAERSPLRPLLPLGRAVAPLSPLWH